MMTLFMFLAGLAVIIGISRYNEDDNLFWKLFIAFIGSFTAACVVGEMMDNKQEQNNVTIVEKAPTQVLASMPCNLCILADISSPATQREKSPKPVGKDKLFNNSSIILSKVRELNRGQPVPFLDDS